MQFELIFEEKMWHIYWVETEEFGWLEEKTGRALPFSAKTVQLLSESRYHTHRKAEKGLGYRPTVDLDEGVARMVAWYRQVGFV